MRNKNTIIALLAIFSVICAFNLWYTYKSFSMESAYSAASQEKREEMDKDVDRRTAYETAQRNAFSLGLDLQGGLFVTMEVGVEDILREYAGTSADADFETALTRAIKQKETEQDPLVNLFYDQLKAVYTENDKKLPENGLLLAKYFASKDRNIGFNTTDTEIIDRLNDDTEKAIQNTFGIIRNRIDQFGVASPTLNLQPGTGRILLELPGVKNPARVKKLLRNSAKLEFRETVTFNEAFPILQKINDKVKTIPQFANDTSLVVKEEKTEVSVAETTSVDTPIATLSPMPGDTDSTGAPLAAIPGDTTDSVNAVASLEDSLGDEKPDSLTAEEYKAQNPFFGRFGAEQLDPSLPLMGYANKADTAFLNRCMRHPDVAKIIPRDVKFLWAKPQSGVSDKEILGLIAVVTNYDNKAPLEGDVITDASQDYEGTSLNAMVNMVMNTEGAKAWARLTKDNIKKAIAIVMDDIVYSYPRVNGVITGGRSQITGNFSVDEAKDLATLLKAGALPVKAKILGDSQIGPTLGAENLSKALFSFIMAFLITILFMFFYYSGSGLVANIALVVNLFYILGVSAALNVVFTLPGLAAVVLTMGMAVDANVLIFERIREEQALGKSFKAAISSGFNNAFSSVMDANITTFLTGLVLFAFGLGPIKGFAVSLMIGIITSLVSALFITRVILDYFANKGTDSIKFGRPSTTKLFSNINMKMTTRKKTAYMISGTLIVLSIASFALNGFKTGVDFQGGRQYKVAFTQEVNAQDFRKPLNDAFENTNPLVRSMSGDTVLLITTSYKNQNDDASDEVERTMLATFESVAPGSSPHTIEDTRVGPTVASDIRRSAVYSVIFSLLIIFIYILIRFRKPQYSLGAIAALFHDVIIVLGIFSFLGAVDILPFSVEVDQSFIAALLTIIGYSINDTVVVFDRIRENMGEMKSKAIPFIYDLSINQTISRTLITSLTTLLTILILFIWGGDVIRGFMFALFVGIIVGTYSSIFVASPVSHDLILASKDGKDEVGKREKLASRRK